MPLAAPPSLEAVILNISTPPSTHYINTICQINCETVIFNKILFSLALLQTTKNRKKGKKNEMHLQSRRLSRMFQNVAENSRGRE